MSVKFWLGQFFKICIVYNICANDGGDYLNVPSANQLSDLLNKSKFSLIEKTEVQFSKN